MCILSHPHLSPAPQIEKTLSTQLEDNNKQPLLPSHECLTMQAQVLTNPQDLKTHFQAPRRSDLNCKTGSNLNAATTIFIPQEPIITSFLKSTTSLTPCQSIYQQMLQTQHSKILTVTTPCLMINYCPLIIPAATTHQPIPDTHCLQYLHFIV
jgi:hypothetical protein